MRVKRDIFVVKSNCLPAFFVTLTLASTFLTIIGPDVRHETKCLDDRDFLKKKAGFLLMSLYEYWARLVTN